MHFRPICAAATHRGPDGNHQLRMQRMQVIHQLLRIRISFRVKAIFVPINRQSRISNPGQYNPAADRAPDIRGQFRSDRPAKYIAPSTVHIQMPTWATSVPTSQAPELMDDLIELRTVDKVIIQFIIHIRPEIGTRCIVMKSHQRVTIQQNAIPTRRDQHGNATFMFCW